MLASLHIVRIPRSSRPTFVPVSRRTLFNFGWWSGSSAGVKKDEPKVEVDKVAPGTPDAAVSLPTSATSNTLPLPTSHPSSSSDPNPNPNPDPTPSPENLPTPAPTPAQIRAQKESAAIRALLDRDGGPAGFGFEDGAPEGGQRRSVKREMFRLI